MKTTEKHWHAIQNNHDWDLPRRGIKGLPHMSQIQVRCALRINTYWFNFDWGESRTPERGAYSSLFPMSESTAGWPNTLARWFPIRPRTCLHICLHVAYALHSIVFANCSFNLFIIRNIWLAACPALLNIRSWVAAIGLRHLIIYECRILISSPCTLICDLGFIVGNQGLLTDD